MDRAALDVALELGLACGGWCPRGRLAEDGAIPAHYPLRETSSRRYEDRTEQNVIDSDATLIVAKGPLSGGTALTAKLAERHAKPLRIADLAGEIDVEALHAWLEAEKVAVLNVAGPRESGVPGICAEATDFLRRLLAVWKKA